MIFLNATVAFNLTENWTNQTREKEIEAWKEILENYMDIVIFLTLVTLCLFLNILAFCAAKERHGPPSGYSLVSMCVSSLAAMGMPIVRILREFKVINLTSYWPCGLWGIYMRMPSALIPCTMLGIFYEFANLKILQRSHLSLKVFLTAWGVAFLISSPMFWTYELVMDDNGSAFICRQVFLFGSPVVQLIYVSIGICCLCIFPSIYMPCALFNMGFRMELLFLCKQIPYGLKWKVRRIRLVFFYMISFIVSMRVSMGVMGLIIRAFFVAHLALQPLFYLYAYGDLSFSNCLRNVWRGLTIATRISVWGPALINQERDVESSPPMPSNIGLETYQASQIVDCGSPKLVKDVSRYHLDIAN